MKRKSQGFTLIELAITLIIIGLLLGGILIPISDTLHSAQVKSNSERLNTAKEALIGFAITNQRLPCPANSFAGTRAGEEPTKCVPTEATYSTNDGTNDRTVSGVLTGVLPWKTLGLQPEDAFSNPIYYSVEKRLTIKSDSDTTVNNSFKDIALNNISLDAITINGRNANAGNVKTDIAQSVAVVLVSLGAETLGDKGKMPVVDADNSTFYSGLGAGDEKDNINNCCKKLNPFDDKPTTKYMVRAYSESKESKAGATNIGAFDDQITWISWYQLIGIMTQAGRLQ